MDRYWPEDTAGEPAPPGYVEGEWCWIHHAHEPGDGYLRCFECGHLWRTGRELVRAYKVGWREARRDAVRVHKETAADLEITDAAVLEIWGVRPPTTWQRLTIPVRAWWRHVTLTAERVYHCPECLHDF